MSASEILNEAELRAARRKLAGFAAENADIAACDTAALAGAQLLDRMEEDDARHQSR
jgi:hypothetical protein